MRLKGLRSLMVCPLVLAATTAVAAPNGKDAKNASRSKTEISAEEQSGEAGDIEVTRLIRRELTTKDSFSVYAQNIKIITKDGRVTLVGPVRSAFEKQEAERIARSVAGAKMVESRLTIEK